MTGLRLSRHFDAMPERVFAAWTDPAVLRRWWAARPEWDSPFAEADVRPGGHYRLAMRDTASGEVRTVTGQYTEVTPPERLAYTWRWEDGGAETLVVVEFRADRAGTTVLVTHSGFDDDGARDEHAHGWSGCLDSLGRRVLHAAAAER